MVNQTPQTGSATITQYQSPGIPSTVATLDSQAAFARHDSVCKTNSGSLPAANIAPPEILLQIYSMLTPRDFDNARRTCSQWMQVSLNRELLVKMLKRAGCWDAYEYDCEEQRIRRPSSEESDVWKMSKRFATECLLSGRKTNVERPGFVITEVVDFSGLTRGRPSKHRRAVAPRDKSPGSVSTFSVSSCGNYLLVTTGCMIHVFRLLGRKPANGNDGGLVPITNIECSFEVLSATLDTSPSGFVVAALLRSRVGMVCDLNVPEHIARGGDAARTAGPVNAAHSGSSRTNIGRSSPHYFYNVCSEDNPPRTIAIYPGRRCIAFGCAAGVEVHWADETTHPHLYRRRLFPMSQPSEVTHFLLNSSNTATMTLRVISSLVGPGVHESTYRQSPYFDRPKRRQSNIQQADSDSFCYRGPVNGTNTCVLGATHCHHYRAVPINDGSHLIFVEPRTGLLCIGSNEPLGGPTSLTRAFVCVPPFGKDGPNSTKETSMPTTFTVGSDLSWGLRVVAAYQDRIVLYSVPLDIFNIIRKERERQCDGSMGALHLMPNFIVNTEGIRKGPESLVQNQNGDWEFLTRVGYQPTAVMWPFKIYGKEIARVENPVELAMQSASGGARVWAFSASGQASVFDIDTFPSAPEKGANPPPCKVVSLASDGSLEPPRLVDRAELATSSPIHSRKRKASELRDDFVGRYGINRYVPSVPSDGPESATAVCAAAQNDDSSIRRPSFAACIINIQIPELGPRAGPWMDR